MKSFLRYTVIPATIGFGTGYVANQLGYDISAVEGMKQCVLAGLPFAVLMASIKNKSSLDSKAIELPAKHPYSFPLLCVGIGAGYNALGGLGMEWVQKMDIGFLSCAGAVEGLLEGMYESAHAIRKKDK